MLLPTQTEFNLWIKGNQDYREGLLLLIRSGIEAPDFNMLQAGPTAANKALLYKLISEKAGTPADIEVKHVAFTKEDSIKLYCNLRRRRNKLYQKAFYYKKMNSSDPAVAGKIYNIHLEINEINTQLKRISK